MMSLSSQPRSARRETRSAIRPAIRPAIRYEPVWSPGEGLVTAHRAMLDEETERRSLRSFGTLNSADQMRSVLFDLDCLILGRAAAGLHVLIGNGGRTQLIVPVNFDSVADGERRMRYRKLCEEIPQADRSFLLFEIRGIPPGTPGARIGDLAVALNAGAHGVLIEMPVTASFERLEAARPAIIGVATNGDELEGTPAKIAAKLKRFATALKARKLKAFLHGADTAALARAAIAAQFDYIDGSSIATATWELTSFYQ